MSAAPSGRTWGQEILAADRALHDAYAHRQQLIVAAVEHGCSVTHIARLLGVSKVTIYRWLGRSPRHATLDSPIPEELVA